MIRKRRSALSFLKIGKMKTIPEEFQITIEDNDKHTIKTENGSFKSSGGRKEVMIRFTKDQGITPEQGVDRAIEMLEYAKDKDKGKNKEWLRGGDRK